MKIQELIALKDKQHKQDNWISFNKTELLSISENDIQHIIEYFHGYTLMRLPEEEIQFFDWLKRNDKKVWDDLWGDEENTYLVSIDLLHHLAGQDAIFPICDLIDEENYWFHPKHIKPEGNEALIDIVKKVESGKELNTAEEFLLQLSGATQDIWHFSYKFNVTLKEMCTTIEEMVYQGWIVHLPNREDLVKYIEV